MAKLINKLKRIRLVYRPSSTLTKTVVLSAVALSMATLLTLHFTISSIQQRTEEARHQAAQLEHENSKLEDKINNQGSAEGVKDYAEDFVGLVDPYRQNIKTGK